MKHRPTPSPRALRAAPWLLAPFLATTLVSLPSCELVGGMMENARRNSTHIVEAEYEGLGGKSFAVLVTADRAIQGEHPGLVEHLTGKITERLAVAANKPTPAGVIPADAVLRYQSRHPDWASKPYDKLAEDLGGIQRLVLVEVVEYRLNEVGNAYEWDGAASGSVRVVEVDGGAIDTFAFDKLVNVRFPDKKGVTPDDVSRSAMTSALALRFIDRTTWNFYAHEEPMEPEY
ncbi:MAG: hypothetical protein U0637_09625 [Phycisphaerales bacterium]